MLFALEEGSSWWHPSMNWRSIFCAMTSSFTCVQILKAVSLDKNSLISGNPTDNVGGGDGFGSFFEAFSKPNNGTSGNHPQWQYAYTYWELPIFILIGIGGGILGAAFVSMNRRITKFRLKYIVGKPFKMLLEAACMAFLMSIGGFFFPYTFINCKVKDLPSYTQDSSSSNRYFNNSITFNNSTNTTGMITPVVVIPPCNSATNSQLVRFLLAPGMSSIENLVSGGGWVPTVLLTTQYLPVITFFVFYFFTTCYTFVCFMINFKSFFVFCP